MFISRGMAQLGEWSKFNNKEQEFPREESFYLGCTMFHAEGMAQLVNGIGS
jgi:hypothetical protein